MSLTLDIQVAKEVFGYINENEDQWFGWRDRYGTFVPHIDFTSWDKGPATMIDLFRKRNVIAEITIRPEGGVFCHLYKADSGAIGVFIGSAQADSLPEALCGAALSLGLPIELRPVKDA